MREPLQLLADADAIAGGTARQVAVGFDPGDRALEALLVVLVGFRECSGGFGELEVELVDGEGELDYALTQCRSTHTTPPPHSHKTILRTSVCMSRPGLVNFRPSHQARVWPAGQTVTPPSQSFSPHPAR